MHLSDTFAEALGWLAYAFSEAQPYLPTYTHLVFAALFPIFAGSYASLSRPPSAAKPTKRRRIRHGIEDDDDRTESRMEGLSLTDAILLPIIASCVLTGLYFIIKWSDAALLNKILNWYFALFSVLAVSRLVSDALDTVHSLAFPDQHVTDGILYSVEARTKTAVPLNVVGLSPLTTPLPGPFSKLPLPRKLVDFAWFLQSLPSRKVSFKACVNGLTLSPLKLGIHQFEGLAIGITSMLYFNFVAKPWWLTNLAGYAFAYNYFQLMSPTTFAIGGLILGGLFFYDIYFVFFTPMMVTVATKLEIPAKLLFPRPADSDDPTKNLAMLGLGDVVIPGMMIALALRFDLYMVYLRKQTKVSRAEYEAKREQKHSTQLAVGEKAQVREDNTKPAGAITSDSTKPNATNFKEVVSATEDALTADSKEYVVIKAPYESPAEAWGNRLWTSPIIIRLTSILTLPFSSLQPATAQGYRPLSTMSYRPLNVFPKPYFTASMVGYIAGMIATLIAMQVSNHAQPALLYLVPGVLGSLVTTALVRGELKEMWAYSEEEDDEEASTSNDKKVEKKEGKERSASSQGKESGESADSTVKQEEKKKNSEKREEEKIPAPLLDSEEKDARTKRQGRKLLSLEIFAPPPFPYEPSAPSYRPGIGSGDDEHPGKRLRTA